MSKATFAKLGLKAKNEIKTITIGEQEIEIKQYLPIEEKLTLIGNVLNNSIDENNLISPVKIDGYFGLEVIYAYTNIAFTDKQKEDAAKLYDLLEENNIINQVVSQIPEVEYKYLYDSMRETILNFQAYHNSALGILERISQDYSDLELSAEDIQQKIGDPQNLTLVKNVMEKLG